MEFDPLAETLSPAPRFSRRREWAAAQAISYLMQQAVENRDVISLAAGLVDPGTLPVAETRVAMERLLASDERGREILQYGTTAGAERLRRHVVRHLATLEDCREDELGVDADQVVLTTGSQQLLSMTADVLLDPGDICLVAAPTYFVFLSVLSGVGARAVAVETDADGIRPEALEAALERLERAGELDRVKLIYLVSYYENPSGVSLAADRRGAVIEIAQRWSKHARIHILEDAAYRELRYDGPELPSIWGLDDSRETVILAQTFSKSFSPGLRVGFGVLPKGLVGPICDRKGNEDFGSANFNQHLMAAVYEQGLYGSHVQQVRQSYRLKRDAMLAAADQWFGDLDGVEWVHPHGGLYVWMTLPESIDTGFNSTLFQQATKTEGVMYVPGGLFYAGEPTPPRSNQMRLSFGVQDPEGIEEGVRRLASAVRTLL